LVLGTADWNQAIATNQHYMVRELSKAYPVTFVESLGLRRPEFSRRDVKRIMRRLRWSNRDKAQTRAVPDEVTVISPKVIPIHSGPQTALNRAILAYQLRTWTQHEGPTIFWTYTPVTYGFEASATVSVYHCVDLYAEFPRIDRDLINRSERKLARAGVAAIGSSEVVVAHLKKQGFTDVAYWPNVADTDEIQRVASRTHVERRKGALFAGNFSDKKVDFALLAAVVESGVELHLAGPVGEGGGEGQVVLKNLVAAGAIYHGTLDLPALSALMVRCEVGLIPYLINPYTLGVSPLKTYEYLAAGLPVVSTALPGVEKITPHVHVVDSHAQFVDAVQANPVSGCVGQATERVRIANLHSWRQRGMDARGLLVSLLNPGALAAAPPK
jgi:teichuronic acid biosynthesis glycosyltransferase TuaH